MALIALMRHRPTRRLAYYAAAAAIARLALVHTCNSMASILARAARRLSAWQYARKYLLHLDRNAIPFDTLAEPRSPRRESSASAILPPISEADEPTPAESNERPDAHISSVAPAVSSETPRLPACLQPRAPQAALIAAG